jgi:hypothetical protein
MADTPPTTPPTTDDTLTPQEESKFSKFLAKFLVEDDEKHPPAPTPTAPSPTPPTPAAPTQAGGTLESAINAVLDRRDRDSELKTQVGNLTREVAELKGRPKKKRAWFSPLFGD